MSRAVVRWIMDIQSQRTVSWWSCVSSHQQNHLRCRMSRVQTTGRNGDREMWRETQDTKNRNLIRMSINYSRLCAKWITDKLELAHIGIPTQPTIGQTAGWVYIISKARLGAGGAPKRYLANWMRCLSISLSIWCSETSNNKFVFRSHCLTLNGQ